MVDCFRVKFTKMARRRIRIRERLKVDDELVGVESLPDVLDAFPNLITNRIGLDCRWRTEGVVVAICAASDCNRPVSIGAGESRVHNDFVDALTKLFLKPAIVGPEPRLGF